MVAEPHPGNADACPGLTRGWSVCMLAVSQEFKLLNLLNQLNHCAKIFPNWNTHRLMRTKSRFVSEQDCHAWGVVLLFSKISEPHHPLGDARSTAGVYHATAVGCSQYCGNEIFGGEARRTGLRPGQRACVEAPFSILPKGVMQSGVRPTGREKRSRSTYAFFCALE
jgi:hypothetical protein